MSDLKLDTIRDRLKYMIQNTTYTLQEYAEEVGLTMGQLNGILYNNVKLKPGQAREITNHCSSLANDFGYDWLMCGLQYTYEETESGDYDPDMRMLTFVETLAEIGKNNRCAKIECEGVTLEFYTEPTQFEVKPTQSKEFDEDILFRSAG